MGLARTGVIATVAALAAAAPAQADRPFTPRFASNVTGDVAAAANTLLSCDSDAPGCAEARAGQAGAKLGNNSWDMQFVDVDSDPATFDSSSAFLGLPSDADVLFAGLYWGAKITRGTHGAAAPDPDARNRALLATPASRGYASVPAVQVDDSDTRSQQGAYQAFADVTDLVRAGGTGTYAVANVQAGTGEDRYAGWSLVVAYESPTAPTRNLTIFDGFDTVNAGDPPHEVAASGFITPRSGPLRSAVGLIAYDGDRSSRGDRALVNGTALADPLTGSVDNLFNSSIFPVLVGPPPPRTPFYEDQLGFGADLMDATGLLPNGATSAPIKLETTSGTYLLGVMWVATELFAPNVQPSKSVTDLNGGPVEPRARVRDQRRQRRAGRRRQRRGDRFGPGEHEIRARVAVGRADRCRG